MNKEETELRIKELHVEAQKIRASYSHLNKKVVVWPEDFKKSVCELMEHGYTAAELRRLLDVDVYNFKRAVRASSPPSKKEPVKHPEFFEVKVSPKSLAPCEDARFNIIRTEVTGLKISDVFLLLAQK